MDPIVFEDGPNDAELVCRGVQSKSGLLIDSRVQMFAANLTFDLQTMQRDKEGSSVTHQLSVWMSVTAMRAVREQLTQHIELAESRGYT